MKRTIGLLALSLAIGGGNAWAALPVERASAAMALKVPGNPAKEYALSYRAVGQGEYELVSAEAGFPVAIRQRIESHEMGQMTVTVVGRVVGLKPLPQLSPAAYAQTVVEL